MVIKNRIILLILLIFALCAIGYKTIRTEGVTFISDEFETKLKNEGFLINLNKEITLGNNKITISKVVFDINSITLAFKSNSTISPLNVNIDGISHLENKGTYDLSATIPPSSSVKGAGYQVITIPHHLDLISQQIKVTIQDFNNESSTFKLTFPGNLIAKQTKVFLLDDNGNVTNNLDESHAYCTIGINYTQVTTKQLPINSIVNTVTKTTLKRSFTVMSSNSSVLTVYEPLIIPRKIENIKYDENTKILDIY